MCHQRKGDANKLCLPPVFSAPPKKPLCAHVCNPARQYSHVRSLQANTRDQRVSDTRRLRTSLPTRRRRTRGRSGCPELPRSAHRLLHTSQRRVACATTGSFVYSKNLVKPRDRYALYLATDIASTERYSAVTGQPYDVKSWEYLA